MLYTYFMVWDEAPIKKTYSIDTLATMATTIKRPKVQSKICGNCGYDFNEYLRTGFLGCSECYHAFHDELEHYLNELR